jgi:hypothetical protein
MAIFLGGRFSRTQTIVGRLLSAARPFARGVAGFDWPRRAAKGEMGTRLAWEKQNYLASHIQLISHTISLHLHLVRLSPPGVSKSMRWSQ